MKKQRVELGAGMVLGGLGLLSDDWYNRLLYRKWLANRDR